MADFKIRPTSGSKLKLQQDGGTDAITIDTIGNVQLAGTMTTGTLTSAVSVPQEVLAKMHVFSFATRTTGNSGRNTEQFTWTSGFTPLDPVNNSLHVVASVPIRANGNDHCGYGPRFKLLTGPSSANVFGSGSGEFNWDFAGQGSCYSDADTADRHSTHSYSFVIPADTLPAGTYQIVHWCEGNDSQPTRYCPNSSDDVRFTTQTSAQMLITEYKNI
jgi:hypothetical protein